MAKTLTAEQIAKKRTELIHVAMEILEKEGQQALTLRRLAADAGMSRSTPYLYFKDKCELIQGVCAETIRYLIKQCREALEECEDNKERLIAMGRCYLKFGIERPVLYQLVFAPARPGGKKPAEIQIAIDEYRELSETPMREAYEDGLIKYPPDRLNRVLWASSHGLLCLRWAGHLSDDELYEQVRQDMEQILGGGFLDKGRYTELYG